MLQVFVIKLDINATESNTYGHWTNIFLFVLKNTELISQQFALFSISVLVGLHYHHIHHPKYLR